MVTLWTPAEPLQLAGPADRKVSFDQVERRIADCDSMYDGNAAHYYGVGQSALTCIDHSLGLAGLSDPASILDFGGGCGRVTRWLKAAYPHAAITVAERTDDQLEACRQLFGVETWLSAAPIPELEAPGSYDLIWAGSVLTHLSAADTFNLLSAFLHWIKPGGMIVVTTHGRRAVRNATSGALAYIDADLWADIFADYQKTGYGYADYTNQPNYGISLTSLDWIGRLVRNFDDARLITLAEAAWDDHQDILALQARRP